MEIHIGNRVAEIELLSKEDNLVCLQIDGEVYEVDIAMLEDGVYSIIQNGKSYNAELSRSGNGKEYKVNTRFSSHTISIIDSKAKYLRMKRGRAENQDNIIISPMPGKIIQIPVKVGDCLSTNDTVVVIEAMKMQNNYKVSSDCVVKEILVTEGDTIQTDQLLIRLELIEQKI